MSLILDVYGYLSAFLDVRTFSALLCTNKTINTHLNTVQYWEPFIVKRTSTKCNYKILLPFFSCREIYTLVSTYLFGENFNCLVYHGEWDTSNPNHAHYAKLHLGTFPRVNDHFMSTRICNNNKIYYRFNKAILEDSNPLLAKLILVYVTYLAIPEQIDHNLFYPLFMHCIKSGYIALMKKLFLVLLSLENNFSIEETPFEYLIHPNKNECIPSKAHFIDVYADQKLSFSSKSVSLYEYTLMQIIHKIKSESTFIIDTNHTILNLFELFHIIHERMFKSWIATLYPKYQLNGPIVYFLMEKYPEEIYLYELQNVYVEVYEWKSPAILHWENTMDTAMLWQPLEDGETA